MGCAGGDMHREMAEHTTILRAPVGSSILGLHIEGTDDRDEMGICVETLQAAVGFSEFEQYIYRTAAEREHKHDAPSQPGDLDLTIYSLRKFLRLAMHGNPTILALLFVPPELCILRDARGAHLQEMAPLIISRQAGNRYLGYLEAQRQRLLGERGQKKVNRPLLEDAHGYDTKYAMHMLRLGYQGVELMETGKLTLPLPEPVRSHIKSVRLGQVSFQDVLTETGEYERQIKDLLNTSPLQEKPESKQVEDWMLRLYLENWKGDAILWPELL
jgi:predicted nucleotidyltransferase